MNISGYENITSDNINADEKVNITGYQLSNPSNTSSSKSSMIIKTTAGDTSVRFGKSIGVSSEVFDIYKNCTYSGTAYSRDDNAFGTQKISLGSDGSILLGTSTGSIEDQNDFIFTGNGNMGIGSANPQSKLHIDGDKIILNNSGSSAALNILAENSTVYLQAGQQYDVTGSAADFFIGNVDQNTSTSSRKFIIKSSGFVGIGTNSPVEAITVRDGDMTTSSNRFLGFNTYNDGTWRAAYDTTRRVAAVKHEHGTQNSIQFRTGNGTYNAGAAITWQPIPYVTNGNFVNASDSRIKTDVAEISNNDAMTLINQLKPKKYKKKSFGISSTGAYELTQNTTGPAEAGLLAQDIYYLAPGLSHLVYLPENANPAALTATQVNNNPNYTDNGWTDAFSSGINYTGLIPYLIKCIQDLDTRVKALENP